MTKIACEREEEEDKVSKFITRENENGKLKD
jgi:hypothetical protein